MTSEHEAITRAFKLLKIDSKEAEENITEKTSNPTKSRLSWFLESQRFSMSQILYQAGPHALASRSAYLTGVQGPMPANQWKQDIQHVWAASLARMQADYVQTAHGRYSQTLSEIITRPQSVFTQDMCDNQVRTTAQMLADFLVASPFASMHLGRADILWLMIILENSHNPVCLIQLFRPALHLYHRGCNCHNLICVGACSGVAGAEVRLPNICPTRVGSQHHAPASQTYP